MTLLSMKPWAAAALGLAVLLTAAGLVAATPWPQPPPPSAPASPDTESGEDARIPADPTPPGGILLLWSRADLPPTLASEAADLSGVIAVAYVRSDTLGLVASRDATGRIVDRFTDGFRVPVEAAAIDPATYAQVMPHGEATEAVAALAPGQVLLSESSAGLRGIGPGGQVDLLGLPGLEVVAVIPDGTVRNAEIVLHDADGDAAGLEPDGALVVRHEAAAGAPTRALTEALRALAPTDEPARVVDAGPVGTRPRARLVLSLLEVKQRFGEFAYRPRSGVREIDIDPGFVEAHIVTAEVPILGSVVCHEAIVADLRAALQEIVDAGLAGAIDPAAYGGCYYPRRISENGDRLSRHSWGIAVDINVDLSLPGLGPPPPLEVVAIFARHGFRWGGSFLQPDNHHFEWVGEHAAPPSTIWDGDGPPQWMRIAQSTGSMRCTCQGA